MHILDNPIVKAIEFPVMVHSEKGRKYKMENRPTYGLSLCISGQITYTMDGKTYISEPGNAILLPKGGNYSLLGDKEGLFPVINFEAENLNCTKITILPLENPQACIQDFETLKNLYLHGRNMLKMYSVFYELLDKVASANSSKHRTLHAATAIIETNIKNHGLSNAALAEQLGISEVYLRKLFATHYNISPKQYILELRISKAKQLLVDTPFSITAIAEECGFSSLYHFCRVFKQRTGQTPTQYAACNRIYKI